MQTTWAQQASRTGRDSAASLTSRSTNSSASTVVYNVQRDPKPEPAAAAAPGAGPPAGPGSGGPDRGGEVQGTLRSQGSEWSCSCYEYSCHTDCSDCGNYSQPGPPAPLVDSHIPIVGNLRRLGKEAGPAPHTLADKRGFIMEDEEDVLEVAELGPSKQISDRAVLQSGSGAAAPAAAGDPAGQLLRAGLLLQLTDSPLVYKNDRFTMEESLDTATEGLKTISLASPKSKGSETGDSGISSHPASISPNSTSSNASSDSSKKEEVQEEGHKVAPPGKRDTMIRELKSKLKERFPSNTLESKPDRAAREIPTDRTRAGREEVGAKLTRMLDSRAGMPRAPPPSAQVSNRVSGASSRAEVEQQQAASRPASREQLYGPGGLYGPRGPFSTPEISRYPEAPVAKRISFADSGAACSGAPDNKSDQSGLFAEDRSDKSQYVTNPVIAVAGAVSRLDSYNHQPEPLEPAAATTWMQEKQNRMINWINKSQVALGGREPQIGWHGRKESS